jgi:GH35 family endo-1,4-beta-xylanase
METWRRDVLIHPREMEMKKQITTVAFSLFMALIFIFTSCNNILDPPNTGGSPATGSEPGKGLVNISLGYSRNILPITVFDSYEFAFTRTGYTTIETDQLTAISLATGTWNLDVNAYNTINGVRTLAATANQDINIQAGTQTVTIQLTPVKTSGDGTFTYYIQIPAGTTVDELSLDDIALGGAVTSGGITTYSGIKTIPAGSYFLIINLTNAAENEAGDFEAVYIYPDNETQYGTAANPKVFASADFKAPHDNTPPIVNTGTTVTSWLGFSLNTIGTGDAPVATRYATYTDKTGTYEEVLRIVPPAAGYAGWGGYAMSRPNINGTVNISMRAWVEKGDDEDVYVFWQGRNSPYPSDSTAHKPLTADQFGKWITVNQTFDTGANMTIALMGHNNATPDEGLHGATVYIRDIRYFLNGNPVIGTHIYPESIFINEKPTTGALSLANDITQQLTLTFAPADTTYKTVTWASSATNVATVSTSGLVTPVTGATGPVTITVNGTGKNADGGNITISDSIALQINPAPVRVKITTGNGITSTDSGVTAATNAITIGDKRTVTATVTGGSGDYEIRWFVGAGEDANVTTNNVARLKAATGDENEVRAIGYTNPKASTVNDTVTGNNAGTGSVNHHTGTGSVTLYARAYQNGNRVANAEPATLTVNTTTASDTSRTMGSFNIGAVYADKFEIGGLTGMSQTDLNNMGFSTVTDANGLKPASTAAGLTIQVGSNNLTYNADTTLDSSILNYQRLSGSAGDTVVLNGSVSANKPNTVTATSGIKLHGHTLIWHESVPNWQRLLGDAAVYTQTASNTFVDSAGETISQRTAQENVRANGLKFLESYLRQVVTSTNFTASNTYLVASWDVLNEVFGERGYGTAHWTEGLATKPWSGSNPSWFDGLRRDDENVTAGINNHPVIWWHSIGPDYVYWAFYYTRKYTPAGVSLVYNDYNLDVTPTKADKAIAMMKWVNDQYTARKAADPSHDLGKGDKLADVLGLQAHYNAADTGVYSNVNTVLGKARTANLHVVVSELTGQAYDWSPEYNGARYSTDGAGAQTHWEMLPRYAEGHTDANENIRGEMTARREMNQAFIFAQAFRAYVANSDVVDRVTFFGISGGLGSYRPYCYPFDGSSRPKPIVYAIMDSEQFYQDHTQRSEAQWPKVAAQGGSGKNNNVSSDFY